MPTSDPLLLTPIVQQILKANPSSVLDVGIGFGKWGALAREYTDVWQRRFYRPQWTTKIHGVEAFAPYLSPHWTLYDRIFFGKIEDVLGELDPHYDLVIFLEVLEHIEKGTALDVLRSLLARTERMLLSYSNFDQHVEGHPLESHVSRWTMKDLEPLSCNAEVLMDDGCTGVVLLSKQ